MPIARKLTILRNRIPKDSIKNAPEMPMGRACSTRAGRPVMRNLISAPVELISSTNVLSYQAPDIAGTMPIGVRHVSSDSSNTDSADEDFSHRSGYSTPSQDDSEAPQLTDASSIEEESPLEGPAPNHLSCYFKPAVETTGSLSRSTSVSSTSPQLPQRAPSHSKKAHERLSRKRSVQRMLSPTRDMVRSSLDIFATTTVKDQPSPRLSKPFTDTWAMPDFETPNPFGTELAQLDEVVEEFGQVVLDAEMDADHAYIESRGLACFDASEYANEISDLFAATFLHEDIWV